jgi:hypothetical protein
MNPDPPTSLPNNEVTKLLNLNFLAKNTPYGFSSETRIIRHFLSGTGNILPKRQPEIPTTTPKPAKRSKFLYTAKDLGQTSEDVEDQAEDRDFNFGHNSEPGILDPVQILDTNPATLKQTMSRPDWP